MARYLRPDEMHQGFAFDFLGCRWDAPQLRQVIDAELHTMGAVGAPSTWVLSNHDVVRHASRLGTADPGPVNGGIRAGDPQPDRALGLRRARAATLLMLALPGAAYLYQGCLLYTSRCVEETAMAASSMTQLRTTIRSRLAMD